MPKVQKTYTREFKREAVRLARPMGSRSHKSPVIWESLIHRSTKSAMSWLNTLLKPSQAAGIRRLSRRNIVVSRENDVLRKAA
jgi:hypothetical protein